MELIEVASGLKFPEGPIAMNDGSVILVEMFGPRITRVRPDGSKETIAEITGGPNGAAIGPDGALYLCNNGGCFTEIDFGGLCFPGPFDKSKYSGGRIQRVDIATGAVTDLYTECEGRPLRAPNDLVFDTVGGFYFTDHGIRDLEARTADFTAIYYAKADGSSIREIDFPVEGPNGIGLSPDGNTLAVISQDALWLFSRPQDGGDQWLSGLAKHYPFSRGALRQLEAVTWIDDATLLLGNEQRDLFRIPLSSLPSVLPLAVPAP